MTEQVVPLRNQPKSSAFINRLKRTRGVAREPPESPERQAMDTAAGLAKASAKVPDDRVPVDRYFDELARNLPARVGHRDDPEPPTVIHTYKKTQLLPAVVFGPHLWPHSSVSTMSRWSSLHLQRRWCPGVPWSLRFSAPHDIL